MNTLKPIETVYNNFRFRSRLEARWAKFFDTLGVPYQYEPEGFELANGMRYLPDFWLPEHRCWIEVKPEEPAGIDLLKIEGFAKAHDAGPLPQFVVLIGLPAFSDYGDAPHIQWLPHWDNYMAWTRCRSCGCTGIRYNGWAHYLPCSCPEDLNWKAGWDDPLIQRAFVAARQARFEKGSG